MARTFVKDPREVVKPGDVVKVKVLDVDVARKRIALYPAARRRSRGAAPPTPLTELFFRNRSSRPAGAPRTDAVGNYDEMSTARLTWLVLDRLVPYDEEAYARAALIARDPELQSLVNQGLMTEDAGRRGPPGAARPATATTREPSATGSCCGRARLATFLGGSFFACLVLNLAR